MKKEILGLSLAFCLMASCAGAPADNRSEDDWLLTTEIEYVTQWPENELTALIPEPQAGTLDYIRDFSAEGRYQLVLKDISQEDCSAYVSSLQQAGYAEVSSEANEASAGTVLQKDGTVLSIAYSDNVLNILITTT